MPITINADLGEQGIHHATDLTLMQYIDVANIACGGHAGDTETVAHFETLANARGVQISAHISYPDKENFGRTSLKNTIAISDLLKSLDLQRTLLPTVERLKFHGALYNDCWHDTSLVEHLTPWIKSAGFTEVLAPPNSEIAKALSKEGITVINEGFIERRYLLADGRPVLMPRQYDLACIKSLEEAITQAKSIIAEQKLPVHTDQDHPKVQKIDFICDTICIHSDSSIAEQLAKHTRALLNQTQPTLT